MSVGLASLRASLFVPSPPPAALVPTIGASAEVSVLDPQIAEALLRVMAMDTVGVAPTAPSPALATIPEAPLGANTPTGATPAADSPAPLAEVLAALQSLAAPVLIAVPFAAEPVEFEANTAISESLAASAPLGSAGIALSLAEQRLAALLSAAPTTTATIPSVAISATPTVELPLGRMLTIELDSPPLGHVAKPAPIIDGLSDPLGAAPFAANIPAVLETAFALPAELLQSTPQAGSIQGVLDDLLLAAPDFSMFIAESAAPLVLAAAASPSDLEFPIGSVDNAIKMLLPAEPSTPLSLIASIYSETAPVLNSLLDSLAEAMEVAQPFTTAILATVPSAPLMEAVDPIFESVIDSLRETTLPVLAAPAPIIENIVELLPPALVDAIAPALAIVAKIPPVVLATVAPLTPVASGDPDDPAFPVIGELVAGLTATLVIDPTPAPDPAMGQGPGSANGLPVLGGPLAPTFNSVSDLVASLLDPIVSSVSDLIVGVDETVPSPIPAPPALDAVIDLVAGVVALELSASADNVLTESPLSVIFSTIPLTPAWLGDWTGDIAVTIGVDASSEWIWPANDVPSPGEASAGFSSNPWTLLDTVWTLFAALSDGSSTPGGTESHETLPTGGGGGGGGGLDADPSGATGPVWVGAGDSGAASEPGASNLGPLWIIIEWSSSSTASAVKFVSTGWAWISGTTTKSAAGVVAEKGTARGDKVAARLFDTLRLAPPRDLESSGAEATGEADDSGADGDGLSLFSNSKRQRSERKIRQDAAEEVSDDVFADWYDEALGTVDVAASIAEPTVEWDLLGAETDLGLPEAYGDLGSAMLVAVAASAGAGLVSCFYRKQSAGAGAPDSGDRDGANGSTDPRASSAPRKDLWLRLKGESNKTEVLD